VKGGGGSLADDRMPPIDSSSRSATTWSAGGQIPCEAPGRGLLRGWRSKKSCARPVLCNRSGGWGRAKFFASIAAGPVSLWPKVRSIHSCRCDETWSLSRASLHAAMVFGDSTMAKSVWKKLFRIECIHGKLGRGEQLEK